VAFGKPPARCALHGGLWELLTQLAHLPSSGDLGARRGVPPAGELLTDLLGVRLHRTQLAALTTS
jgi:hypothetical protein